MSEPVISVRGLGKQYRLGATHGGMRYKALRDVIAGAFSLRKRRRPDSSETFWALRDVSFDVAQGEVLGIIGRNGAGKSTLLKILSGITEPTTGEIHLRGRVASLLEVGTGFHPELTGKENIYLNGAILGMTRREISGKFDEIVDFAGVEKFIDTPVKRYSSGMYVRLAFAVAAHLEPEILVIDEVLAVGDVEFQKQCLGKMGDVARGGRTVLFVSHNMAAVQVLCKKLVRLERGRIVFQGDVREGIDGYLLSAGNNEQGVRLRERVVPSGSPLFIKSLGTLDSNRRPTDTVLCGSTLYFCIDYECQIDGATGHFALDVDDARGNRITYCNPYYSSMGGSWHGLPRAGRALCEVPKLPLMPGQYTVHVAAHCNGERSDFIQYAMTFDVLEGDYYGTGRIPGGNPPPILLMEHDWHLQATSPTETDNHEGTGVGLP